MNTVPILVSFATAASVGAVLIAGVSARGLRSELARLEERLDPLPSGPSGLPDPPSSEPPPELARLTRALEAAEQRLARLEAGSRRELVAAAEATGPRLPADAPSTDRTAETSPADEAAKRAELEALLELFDAGFDWEGESAKLQRFYELARETDLIDDKIAALEATVEANPGDLEGRMDLADTYVAKLMTIQGPEQGLWGMKTEEQWRAVVDLDENHWESTFNLGNNFAYYPDVMGKTDEAIAFLERAQAIQERSTQGDEHVQTYLSLARMHQRKGDLDEARRVLAAGLRYHPGNASLEAALASLD